VTVPVAAEGETVAVKVTLAPSTGVEVDDVSVVVVAVVPVGACQKSPQPLSSGATASISSIRTMPPQTDLSFTILFLQLVPAERKKREHCRKQKLIDVYPEDYPDSPDTSHGSKRILDGPPLHMGGYQQLLRGEPFRAKFRNGWEKPEALTPGTETEVDFTMPDLFHTFRRGHRIMVQVESSWFPLTDRNPQTFTDIPNARPEEFQKATEQIFRKKGAASSIEVLVLPQS
jgi:hypothetical protein